MKGDLRPQHAQASKSFAAARARWTVAGLRQPEAGGGQAVLRSVGAPRWPRCPLGGFWVERVHLEAGSLVSVQIALP